MTYRGAYETILKREGRVSRHRASAAISPAPLSTNAMCLYVTTTSGRPDHDV
jgi:hypothetical protein